MRRSVLALASILAASALGAWACSFPDILIAGEASGSGGRSSSSTAGGAAGSGGSTASSTSSMASASSGGSGGSGGAPATSSSASGSSSGSCTTDEDGDTYISWTCDQSDPMKDCADEDTLAHPGAGFQPAPIKGVKKPGTLPFDFNCDGSEDAETGVLTCPGLSTFGCPAGTGYEAAVMCGQSALLGNCVPAGLYCAWAPVNPSKNLQQRCK